MSEEEKDTMQEQDQQSAASAAASPQLLPPKPTRQEVQNCQFSAWYSTFRNLSKKSSINNNNFHTTTTTSAGAASSLSAAQSAAPSYRNATKFRKNLTIESHIISPLPSEFIDYLKCNGSVRLPLCAMNVSSCLKADYDGEVDSADDDDGEWDDDNNNSDDEEDEVKQYNFPELTQQIQDALQSLSSSSTTSTTANNTNNITGCIPKLNWSSPKDATWINCGTLQCKTPGDIYLLLKSSEFIMFDLENAWVDLDDEKEEGGEEVEKVVGDDGVEKEQDDNSPPPNFEYELVLRKWCNLHPSMEFRCFIYNHELIAISQRHPTKFYSHLQLSEEDDNEIHPTTLIIHSFYKTYIQHRFANGDMTRYVMDVYVDSQERTWIVDFNVWGTRTDSLLFDWDELMKIGNGVMNMKKRKEEEEEEEEEDYVPMMPELRVVTKDMKDLTYDPLSSFRGPTDVMDLLGAGGGSGGGSEEEGGFEGNPSFRQFMEQCVRPSEM